MFERSPGTLAHRGQRWSPQSTTGARRQSHEDKAKMLMDIPFPPPTPYDGDESQEGPSGMACQAVDKRLVASAFQGNSKKKSPRPDGVGPLAIACVYEWQPNRIVALVRAHIRLGVHPGRWKVARGVTIPKPGRELG